MPNVAIKKIFTLSAKYKEHFTQMDDKMSVTHTLSNKNHHDSNKQSLLIKYIFFDIFK